MKERKVIKLVVVDGVVVVTKTVRLSKLFEFVRKISYDYRAAVLQV